MISPQLLAKQYERSAQILLTNLEGLTQEQSLWQPSPDVNSINWIAGHLIHVRSVIAGLVGLDAVWDDETRLRYVSGSSRIIGEDMGVLPIERLVADFTTAQAGLDTYFASLAANALEAPSPSRRFDTLGEHLSYLQFHETHHAGQIMILREQLGKPSVWPF